MKSEWIELLAQEKFEQITSGRILHSSCKIVEDVDERAPLVPLEPWPGLVVRPHYYENGVPGTSPAIRVRAPLVARLRKAASLMPAGFRLAVLDGWRSEVTQRAIYGQICESIAPLGSSAATFAFDLDCTGAILDYPSEDAPHRTGGAVDVLLADPDGLDWDMGSDFDEVSLRSATSALEGDKNDQDEPARIGRRALLYAMTASDFSNYPAEWWHYDYGNAFWRYYSGLNPGSVFRTVVE